MCQAIYKPVAVTIDETLLRAAWQSNSDGAGFAYRDGNKVRIEKGFTKLRHFLKAYKHVEAAEMVIHFRFATHGGKDKGNCHPFRFLDGAFAHNGILWQYAEDKGKESDTVLFRREFLRPLAKVTRHDSLTTLLTSDGVTEWLERHIGGGNRLVFLHPAGHTIINEDEGSWIQGAWFSGGNPLDSVYCRMRSTRTSVITYDDKGIRTETLLGDGLTDFSEDAEYDRRMQRYLAASGQLDSAATKVYDDAELWEEELCYTCGEDMAEAHSVEVNGHRICDDCWCDMYLGEPSKTTDRKTT